MDDLNLEELLAHPVDTTKTYSWAQLSQEHPQVLGGLKQLALNEAAGRFNSTVVQRVGGGTEEANLLPDQRGNE